MSNDVIKFKINKVIKLSATWCGPCKQYAPTFDEVSQEYIDDWKIINMDFDTVEGKEFAELAGIRGVPATIFVVPGAEINVVMGAQSAQTLRKIFDSYENKNDD